MMNFVEFTPESLLGPLNEVEAKNAPARLYVAGDTSVLEAPRVAVVGSRKASEEGLRRAHKLSRLLCQNGVAVVSGLAEGIDTAAHTGALSASGRTVAVIGTPLDISYPPQNAALQARLMEEQLVVSQFPVGYKVGRASFPMRNRTMALIADATVIIEAADTSGSLSQGWEALRLGRQLYIAQSIIDGGMVTWPKEMLHYGARVLTEESFAQLLEELPPRSAKGLAHAAPF